MTLNDLEKLVNIKNLHTDVGSAMAIIDACSVEDVKKILDFLNEYEIVLNELKDLRVLLVPLNQIQAKIRNLEEANALDLAKQRPSVLTSNDSCLSICNRINICIQDGIEYKDSKGNYYPFIWNKREWDKKNADLISYARHSSNLSADDIIKDFDNEHPNFEKEVDNKKVEENLNQANEIIAEQNEKEISEILNNPEEYREPDILADDNAFTFEPVEDIKPVDPSEALAAIEEQRKALEAAKKEALGASKDAMRDEVNQALDDELNFLDVDFDVDDNKLGGRR